MKRKISYRTLMVSLIVLTVILFSACESQEDVTTLKIGYNTESVNHAPIMVGHDAGIFEKYGINVEMVPLKSGKEIQQALAIGKLDIGSGGATNYFVSMTKGAPIKIIAPCTVSPTSVFVRPDRSITKLEDLIGKSVASRIGESSNMALGYALIQEGVNFDEIEFIDIDKTTRPIALMDKKIVDASVAGQYEQSIYSEHGAIVLEEWETKGYDKKAFPRTVIAVNSDFMKDNKEVMGKFVDALIESHEFIKDNPDEAAEIIAEHIEKGSAGAIELSSEDVKKSWEEVKYVLWYEPSDFVEISKVAEQIGDVERSLELDEIFDLSFEEDLKNSHGRIYGAD